MATAPASFKDAGGRTLFVADLHLTDKRPQATERFFWFLENAARDADALYILGDLFEYWVGDDDIGDPLAQDTARRLEMLANAGTRLYFMHGNRDFLLAKRFAELSGMTLLADPALANLYGTLTVLTHGDLLCTDDRRYQAYRRLIRQPRLQKLLTRMPLGLRHWLAGSARAGSERAKAAKPIEIMDVNPDAVARMFRQHGADRMIHGHTHRPARHDVALDGRKHERWVLPDWYGNGGYLACTEEGCALVLD
jgi:UDP-2,3-diacylglucosamine hydrolase